LISAWATCCCAASKAALAENDTIERGEQHLDLACAPIQLLGDQKSVGCVVLSKWEDIDKTARLPFGQAVSEIALDAGGSLVAIFGCFGKQLHHDIGDRHRQARDAVAGRRRPARDVAVDQFHRVRSGKRQDPGEHSVEGDAERVEVAAGIDRPVHSPCLLGRHVGERSGDRLGRMRRLAFARQA
jgi:hypothetical protein